MRMEWPRFKRWAAPPVFPEDETKTRRAELLTSILRGFVVVVLLYGVVSLLFLPNPQIALPLVGGLVVLQLVVWGLMRRGFVAVSAWLLVALLWAFLTFVVLFFGGVNGVAVWGYVVVVVIAGLLLGDRGGILFAAAGVVAALVFGGLEARGALPPSQEEDTVFSNVALLGLYSGLCVVVLRAGTHSLQDALRHSGEDRRQLQAAHITLEERTVRLQTMVNQYAQHMRRVAQGDLATQIDFTGLKYRIDDPLFILGHQLNATLTSLRDMVAQIGAASNALSAGVAEILTAVTQQVSGIAEQSASIAQTTTTVDAVRVISEQAIARSEEVAQAARRTVQVSQSGQQSVEAAIASMEEIKVRVGDIAENVLTVSLKTQQIGDIITTVNELATRSNILALNAAIEAARAGEQGQGFAVVAAEVRTLANQSKQATAQIRAILIEIQQGIQATVIATEEGTRVVDNGAQLAARAQAAIAQLTAAIDESAQGAVQVAVGGQQQAAGMEQIALAMQAINQTMQQSLLSTRQVEQAARDLHTLAQALTQLVQQYTL